MNERSQSKPENMEGVSGVIEITAPGTKKGMVGVRFYDPVFRWTEQFETRQENLEGVVVAG